MTRYEYKTLPAPRRERRARGKKAGADAFAHAIEDVLNHEAAAGWEFQRAESLPCDERKGIFGGRHEVLHAILVFRRALDVPAQAPAPAPAPARTEPEAAPEGAPASLFNVND